MKKKVVLYWARRDLRCFDNPALSAALSYSKKEHIPFLPIFILEDYMTHADPKAQFGYPSRFFLTKALPLFAKNFSNFTLIRGKAGKTILSLAKHFDITVFVNEDVYKDFYTQIHKVREQGVDIKLYADMLTVSKETRTGNGNLYSVFTPFKNAVWNEFCTAKVLPKVHLAEVMLFQDDIAGFVDMVSCTEESLRKTFSNNRTFSFGGNMCDINTLLPKKETYDGWYWDEAGALHHFDMFLKRGVEDYKKTRDSLDREGTSRMSLALAWGLVSARTLRARIQKHFDRDFLRVPTEEGFDGPVHYISELIWREFYKYLLYHHPELMDQEFQEKFRGAIRWVEDKAAQYRFKQWIKGETGYPIVDAAMMELAQTGYMHNRARMIVASVLTKNFGVDWRWGQEYFRAMLIDLDEASNNGGWQWGASVGADPKPIRIFNPYLQAENYDNEKVYQKRYLNDDYFGNPPEIIVDHRVAREEALMRYGLSSEKGLHPRDY